MKNERKSVLVSIFLGRYAEGMKMCSFTGYKCKSCIIVQFLGFKLVNEKYHRPNLYSEPDVGMQLTAKKIQSIGPDCYKLYIYMYKSPDLAWLSIF